MFYDNGFFSLYDGQGTVRQAILYRDGSCLFCNILVIKAEISES